MATESKTFRTEIFKWYCTPEEKHLLLSLGGSEWVRRKLPVPKRPPLPPGFKKEQTMQALEEKVFQAIAAASGAGNPMTRAGLRKTVRGKINYLVEAVDRLIRAGRVQTVPSPPPPKGLSKGRTPEFLVPAGADLPEKRTPGP